MSVVEDRREADRDIEEVFGLVPEFFQRVPDYLLPTEWASFKSLVLSDQTAIPNKYKELIGLAVSGATRCRYCAYFHTEAARLFGATEDEVNELLREGRRLVEEVERLVCALYAVPDDLTEEVV